MSAPTFTSVQEACDYAVRQLVQQGTRCVDPETGDCVYGDAFGNHCGVGWLLDHTDDFLMEYAGSIGDLCNDMDVNGSLDDLPPLIRDDSNMEIWLSLQSFHDYDTAERRRAAMESLRELGIDTSGEHWQQWVDLGRDR